MPSVAGAREKSIGAADDLFAARHLFQRSSAASRRCIFHGGVHVGVRASIRPLFVCLVFCFWRNGRRPFRASLTAHRSAPVARRPLAIHCNQLLSVARPGRRGSSTNHTPAKTRQKSGTTRRKRATTPRWQEPLLKLGKSKNTR